MSEREFWHFVWLAGVRLPFVGMQPLMAARWALWACIVFVVARYLGISLPRLISPDTP
jgi:hypothetical protein